MRRHEAFSGRSSAQRLAIARAADEVPGAFTAEELLQRVRARSPRVGPATVYRTLAAMAEAGFVERVGSRDGAAAYARCRSSSHHHHVVCTGCGAVAEAECDLKGVLGRVTETCGYEVTGHDLTLHGVCPRCRKRGA